MSVVASAAATSLLPSRRRILGASLVGAVALLGLLGPALIAADPARQVLGDALLPPGGEYLLGTDHLGRSMLARLAHASRLSLALAVVTVLTAALPGTALGLLAAWRGGWTERLLVALADSVLALPGLLLVLLLAALAPGAFWPLYLGLSLVLWVEYFRLVRATATSLLASPQVEAARLLDLGAWHVVRRHVLPEIAPLVGTLMAFGAATAVMAVAALSFVGIGLRPPMAEWGLMLTELLPYGFDAPLQLLMPAALVFVTVLGRGPAHRRRRQGAGARRQLRSARGHRHHDRRRHRLRQDLGRRGGDGHAAARAVGVGPRRPARHLERCRRACSASAVLGARHRAPAAGALAVARSDDARRPAGDGGLSLRPPDG
jgi:peptide/nickel transport system permease protein